MDQDKAGQVSSLFPAYLEYHHFPHCAHFLTEVCQHVSRPGQQKYALIKCFNLEHDHRYNTGHLACSDT